MSGARLKPPETWGDVVTNVRSRDPDADLEQVFRAYRRWASSNGNGSNGHADGHPGDDFEHEVADSVRRMEIRDTAVRRYRASTQEALDLPPTGWTLTEALKDAPEEVAFTIDHLHVTGGNTLVVAKYKTGKTTLGGNLLKALADETPFLGVFDTHFAEGRVAYLNYELSPSQFVTWLRDLEIENADRIVPVQLRGKRLPFWVPEARDRFAAWLRANEVRALVLDPVGRAWRGLVENENDNANVRDFTDALDELKAAADVADCWIAHHTGRKEHEQDAEHSRGATTLEDWMDVGWYLTKERDGTRMFRADGRDVDVPTTALSYEQATREVFFTGQTRAQRRKSGDMVKALMALRELDHAEGRYPAPVSVWREAIEGIGKDTRGPVIKAAVADGYVKVEPGEKNAKLHSLTKKGRVFLREHEEGDR
ncbi:MAG TPA: AAA family ATPase [Conexibacter sp.]|nr:AAA family ATPase [Conexibacter sp.]